MSQIGFIDCQPELNMCLPKYFCDNCEDFGWNNNDMAYVQYDNPRSIDIVNESEYIVLNPSKKLIVSMLCLLTLHTKKFAVLSPASIDNKAIYKMVIDNQIIPYPNMNIGGHRRGIKDGYYIWFTNNKEMDYQNAN